MAENPANPVAGVDQISTLDVAPSVPPTPPTAGSPATPVPPTQPAHPAAASPNAASPYGDKSPGSSPSNQQGDVTDPTLGVGIEGELDVWEGRYSMRNFVGQIIGLSLLSVVLLVMALATWDYEYTGLKIPTVLVAIVVVFLWVSLGFRVVQALLGHKYRLTTRRLFVSTGIFRRETDQLELLRVQDVFHRQTSLIQRILNVGAVVIVSSEKLMPNYTLAGVADPKQVMDLVWHHARAEQDQRNVRVEQI